MYALNLLVTVLVLLGGLSTSRAACIISDCGTFCCPKPIKLFAISCCRDSQSCCIPGTVDASISTTCGDQQCPNDLADKDVYDPDNHIREECCYDNSTDCCSLEENLDVLGNKIALALGLGVGLGALVLIMPFLVCCCCLFLKKRRRTAVQ